MGDPLNIAEKVDLLVKKLRLLFIQCAHPLARCRRGAVLLRPVAGDFIVVVPCDQSAEERIGLEPFAFATLEGLKVADPRLITLATAEIFMPQRQKLPLERLDLAIAHRPLAQSGDIVLFCDPCKIILAHIRQPLRADRKRNRLVGERTDDIIRAAVRPCFINRQNLDKPETRSGSPSREFDERFGVADANIIRPTNRADWREDAADFVFRGKKGRRGYHRVSGFVAFVSCAHQASNASRVRTCRAPHRGQVTVSDASPPKSPSASRLKTGAIKSSIRP